MSEHDFDSPGGGGAAGTAAPSCPKCQGPMWDNREGKRNPKAPDFKCKDRDCGGVIWPPRNSISALAPTGAASPAGARAPSGAAQGAAGGTAAGASPACPICGGPMWDDRSSKRNPRAPDFKCKNRPRERGGPGCEGVIWPPRDGQASPYGPPPAPRAPRADAAPAGAPPRPRAAPYDAPAPRGGPPPDDTPPPDDDDYLPF